MSKAGLENWTKAGGLKRLREVLTSQVSHPIWWEIPGERPKELDYTKACRTCHFVQSSAANRRTCQVRFLKEIGQAGRKGGAHQFLCPIQRYAVILPLQQNGHGSGYLALCHSEQAIPRSNLQLATLAVETTLLEQERARELKTLSETIQPRCVALSTIHTIHRLISSTLNLEELVPRVARLCCQVVRAQFCAIWFIDSDKQRLTLRAAVDLSKAKPSSLRSYRVGSGKIGQVASSWKPSLRGREMIVPLVDEECVGVILVRRARLGGTFSALDQEILTTLSEQAVVAVRNAQMYETQERVTWGTIKSMTAILEGMDTTAPGGSVVSRPKLMADVALAVAQKMGTSSSLQKSVQYAAMLHDAGRVGIPEGILRKPSKLEPAEYAKVKEHPVKGASILQPIDLLEPAIPIILHHHERFDGAGYPKGLEKEAIPLGARILAVANAFEAMVSGRPYRKALSVAESAREIASHSGTQFDPKVVKAFLDLANSGKLETLVSSLLKKGTGAGGK